MPMKNSWSIVFTPQAEKAFSKLDRPVQQEIERYLTQKVLAASHPRALGKALKANLSDFWSCRTGNYRILCKIEDHELIVVVVRIAHRKEVYTQH